MLNPLQVQLKTESSYRRIQRFFQAHDISKTQIANFVLKLTGTGPYLLTIDRTNWKYGKSNINILAIEVVHKGTTYPIS